MLYLVVAVLHWNEPLILVIFVLGFFSNVVLAVILVYVGDLIGINLYYESEAA